MVFILLGQTGTLIDAWRGNITYQYFGLFKWWLFCKLFEWWLFDGLIRRLFYGLL